MTKRKVVLITGANRGIGKATVAAALDEDEAAFVLLGSRSLEGGEEARRELVADDRGREGRIEVVEIDVASDESVAEAVEQIGAQFAGDGLYGVVNNAGIGHSHPMERILEVNAYGPHRVCEAVLPLLNAGSRVVNVSSASGPKFVANCSPDRQELLTSADVRWGEIDALMQEALRIEEAGGDFAAAGLGDGSAYGLSKACLNAYTIALAREHPELTINACTPGFIETDMTRGFATSAGKSPRELGMKAPEEGTRAQMHLLFGEPAGSGWYFGSDAERSPLDRYRSPGDPPYTGD